MVSPGEAQLPTIWAFPDLAVALASVDPSVLRSRGGESLSAILFAVRSGVTKVGDSPEILTTRFGDCLAPSPINSGIVRETRRWTYSASKPKVILPSSFM